MSSVSRRQLARRRQHCPRVPPVLWALLALVVVGVLAFVAGHGGF